MGENLNAIFDALSIICLSQCDLKELGARKGSELGTSYFSNSPEGGSSGTILAVIPTYNGSKYITNALTSLLGQSYQPLKILIIDDCSTEDMNIPKNLQEKYELVRNPANLGFSGTLNKILQMADSYQYVFVLQDDCELLDVNYIEKALKKFNSDMVGIVSGRAIVKPIASLFKRAFARMSYLDYAPPNVTPVSYSLLKADLIRVSHLKSVGGFTYSGDRRLGLEDQTLGYRFDSRGYMVLIDPSITYAVNYARDETFLSLLCKESKYGRTLGFAVVMHQVSTIGKSEWDRLRINHRKAQVISTGFMIMGILLSIGFRTPLPFLFPAVGSILYNGFQIRKSSYVDRILFPVISFFADLVFGLSFAYGAMKGFMQSKDQGQLLDRLVTL